MTRQRFADQLRFHRRAAGFSQEELAEQSGLSVRAISDLERGVKQRPYPETVRMLAQALGLEGDELLAFRLAATGQPPAPVPESAAATTASPLPQPLTALIGREDDLATLSHLLAPGSGPRLVTLTGTGGVGKTRLAVQLALQMGPRYRQGATCVELASVATPAQVMPVLAMALGIREHPERSALDSVIRVLQHEQRLLVLDNLEQVIDVAAEIGALLGACPELTVLATSRAPLRLVGEHEVPVPPLGLPERSREYAPATLLRFPAVRLFVERAQAQLPGFAIGPENATDVATICQTVDGLPLALELAAGRMKVLPAADLVTHLGQRLAVLSRGSRNLPLRHQALRETIAWSHNLLTPDEQQAFRAFGVLVGGASLEAVATVVFAGDTLAAIEMLSDLQDQSLLHRQDAPDGTARFQMLETIREFALEQLAASDEAVAVRQRHADHFLTVAEAGEEALRGPDQARWMRLLEADYGNLRAAMAWHVDRKDAEASQRMGSALWRFWAASGRLREGRDLLDRALFLESGARTMVQGRALLRAGNLALDLFDYGKAQRLYEESVAVLRGNDDQVMLAGAMMGLGLVSHETGHLDEAWTSQESARELFQRSGIPAGVGQALQNLALIALSRGELERCREYLNESLEIRLQDQDIGGIAYAHYWLGTQDVVCGNIAASGHHFRQSQHAMQAIGDKVGMTLVQLELGTLALYAGDSVRAKTQLMEALDTLVGFGQVQGEITCLERWAEWLMDADLAGEAAVISAAVDDWYRSHGITYQTRWEIARRRLREQFGNSLTRQALEMATQEGKALGYDGAIARTRDQMSRFPDPAPDSAT